MRTPLLVGLLVAGALVAAGVSYSVTHPAHFQYATTRSSGEIAGQVLTLDGVPVSAARVYALKGDFTTGRVPMFFADREGNFKIKDLASGTYKVFAAKEDAGYADTGVSFYSAGLVEAPQVTVYEGRSTSDVVVHLGPRAAKLKGRVMDAKTSKPIAAQDIQITLRREDAPDNPYTTAPNVGGRFEMLVPPAPVTVEVSAPGYEKKHLGSLRLRPEEVRRLDVSLNRVE